MPGLDNDTLRHALQTAKASGIRVVKLRNGPELFSAVFREADEFDEEEVEESSEGEAGEAPGDPEKRITAPVVGYFKAGKRVLEPGAIFEQGEPVGEIVSLGLANEVQVPFNCEILEVMVAPGEPVEYGQVLATLRSTP